MPSWWGLMPGLVAAVPFSVGVIALLLAKPTANQFEAKVQNFLSLSVSPSPTSADRGSRASPYFIIFGGSLLLTTAAGFIPNFSLSSQASSRPTRPPPGNTSAITTTKTSGTTTANSRVSLIASVEAGANVRAKPAYAPNELPIGTLTSAVKVEVGCQARGLGEPRPGQPHRRITWYRIEGAELAPRFRGGFVSARLAEPDWNSAESQPPTC